MMRKLFAYPFDPYPGSSVLRATEDFSRAESVVNKLLVTKNKESVFFTDRSIKYDGSQDLNRF
jgi:hypothetical protein